LTGFLWLTADSLYYRVDLEGHQLTAPLDLLAAQTWRRALFTTYALSLSFFEAVILDALVRSNSREALILADVAGVKAALGEKGAFRAGRGWGPVTNGWAYAASSFLSVAGGPLR
jgi:hypothetical protein